MNQFKQISNILTNNKDKKENNSKSGVYCVNCYQCHAVYYGQTGRNLSIWAVENFKSINKEVFHTMYSFLKTILNSFVFLGKPPS